MRMYELLNEETNLIGTDQPEYYESVVEFLRDTLNIPEGVRVSVSFKPNMQMDSGQDGLTVANPNNPNHIFVFLRAGMPASQTTRALAHEFVHVKQLVDGRLNVEIAGGQLNVDWEGKRTNAKKYSRSHPWEVEAHNQERELLNQIIKTFGNPNT